MEVNLEIRYGKEQEIKDFQQMQVIIYHFLLVVLML
jgi:hypothetical protein